jgi:hypothetical protein
VGCALLYTTLRSAHHPNTDPSSRSPSLARPLSLCAAGMKADMGGSAAILCAWKALVESFSSDQTESNRPIHALLCLAENSVGPDATRPDDVHVFYSGESYQQQVHGVAAVVACINLIVIGTSLSIGMYVLDILIKRDYTRRKVNHSFYVLH